MIRPAPLCLNDFIDAAEGREREAYRDTNGTWTIGVGHTGLEVQPGLVWTDGQIDAQRDADVAVAISRLEKRLKPHVILSLTDHQYAALISFAFNMGAGSSWKIWKVVNGQAPGWEGDTITELRRFINETLADGSKRVVPGLVNRREAEIKLFCTPEAKLATKAVQLAAEAPMATSSGTLREADTPPTPAEGKALAKRPSFLSGIAGLVLGAPVMITTILNNFLKPVMDAIAPFAGQSEHVGRWVGYLAMACAVAVALTVILQALERQKEKH